MIIITAGIFGAEVATILSTRTHAPTLSISQVGTDLEQLLKAGERIGVALWRPHIEDCELVDVLCHKHNVRWSLAVLSGTTLSCGPLVIPEKGPCYACYRKRYLSHHPSPDREMAIRAAYKGDPELGVFGHVRPLVNIAAEALWEDLHAPDAQAGRLRVVDVLTAAVLETNVIGVHACPYCGVTKVGSKGRRYVSQLLPAIEELLGE